MFGHNDIPYVSLKIFSKCLSPLQPCPGAPVSPGVCAAAAWSAAWYQPGVGEGLTHPCTASRVPAQHHVPHHHQQGWQHQPHTSHC